MVVGIEARINSNGFAAKRMEDNNSCLDGKSFNGTAGDGLEVGTSSDGLVVASMEINCIFSAGFNSGGHEVAQMELNGSYSDGFNSVDFTMVPGKTDMVNLQLSKGIFLANP